MSLIKESLQNFGEEVTEYKNIKEEGPTKRMKLLQSNGENELDVSSTLLTQPTNSKFINQKKPVINLINQ